MQSPNLPRHTKPNFAEGGFSTEELASLLGLKPNTLRAALCKGEGYFGVHPTKLKNGRLRWPADSVQRLTASGDAENGGQR